MQKRKILFLRKASAIGGIVGSHLEVYCIICQRTHCDPTFIHLVDIECPNENVSSREIAARAK